MKTSFLLLLSVVLCGCAVRKPVSACLKPHYPFLWSDADKLDHLGYCGPHRAVYIIGSDRCYTNDDRVPYPQSDMQCF